MKEITFERLKRNRDRFLKDPCRVVEDEGALTELICGDCEFYKEGEDEELACGAYNILATLLKKRVITVDDIVRNLTDE